MTGDAATPLDLLGELRANRLVAILRGRDPNAIVNSALTLAESGIVLLEVSLSSASALDCIETLAAEFLGSPVILGAGTVVEPGDARRCRDAGARFAVTPAMGAGVLEAVELRLPVLAGALTPTEVVAVHAAGASAAKIFPASVFGPGYLRALAAPLPHIPLFAVGGIDAEHIPDYLAAGAVGVGVASPLLQDAGEGGDLVALRARAAAFLRAVAADG